MKNYNLFLNGFKFQYLFLKENLHNFKIDFFAPNNWEQKMSWYSYILKNFFQLRKKYKIGAMKKYDIVHINNTENFLNFKKYPKQVSIAESHWFDFWVNYERFLKDEKNIIKKCIWWIIDKLIWNQIRKKINEFDIYYCSTPDMLEPLKKIRKDVIWLPNPINTHIFNPQWKIIKLEWNPACFFPTRLHWDKRPEYAIKIFQEYIKPNYPEATLHVLNQWFEVEKYKKILNDKKTYYRHDFMDKETLAAKIRWSDFCFWDFSIWWLSLMPMQIMACRKPIVTYDMHELIKIPREKLLELTKKIFEDDSFREEYIERNYNYIMDFHSEKAVIKKYQNNLQLKMKEKWII